MQGVMLSVAFCSFESGKIPFHSLHPSDLRLSEKWMPRKSLRWFLVSTASSNLYSCLTLEWWCGGTEFSLVCDFESNEETGGGAGWLQGWRGDGVTSPCLLGWRTELVILMASSMIPATITVFSSSAVQNSSQSSVVGTMQLFAWPSAKDAPFCSVCPKLGSHGLLEVHWRVCVQEAACPFHSGHWSWWWPWRSEARGSACRVREGSLLLYRLPLFISWRIAWSTFCVPVSIRKAKVAWKVTPFHLALARSTVETPQHSPSHWDQVFQHKVEESLLGEINSRIDFGLMY